MSKEKKKKTENFAENNFKALITQLKDKRQKERLAFLEQPLLAIYQQCKNSLTTSPSTEQERAQFCIILMDDFFDRFTTPEQSSAPSSDEGPSTNSVGMKWSADDIAAMKQYVQKQLNYVQKPEDYFKLPTEVKLFLRYSNYRDWHLQNHSIKEREFWTNDYKHFLRNGFFTSKGVSWSISKTTFFLMGALIGGLGSVTIVAGTAATLLATLSIAAPPVGLSIFLTVLIGAAFAISFGLTFQAAPDKVHDVLWHKGYEWISNVKFALSNSTQSLTSNENPEGPEKIQAIDKKNSKRFSTLFNFAAGPVLTKEEVKKIIEEAKKPLLETIAAQQQQLDTLAREFKAIKNKSNRRNSIY